MGIKEDGNRKVRDELDRVCNDLYDELNKLKGVGSKNDQMSQKNEKYKINKNNGRKSK